MAKANPWRVLFDKCIIHRCDIANRLSVVADSRETFFANFTLSQLVDTTPISDAPYKYPRTHFSPVEGEKSEYFVTFVVLKENFMPKINGVFFSIFATYYIEKKKANW